MLTLTEEVIELHKERSRRIVAVHNDIDHYYRIDGIKWEPSVTTYINEVLFAQFDEDQVITKMVRSPRWSQSKYYPRTPDSIKLEWEQIRTEASQLGLAMHTNLENYYHWLGFKSTCYLILMAKLNEPACAFAALSMKTIQLILFKYKRSLDKVLKQNKEFELFTQFTTDYPNLVHYQIEWQIFEEETRLAGSVDMIYRDPENPGMFLIYDWKRSKEIKYDNKWQNGIIAPTSHLADSNYWHFSLQLNIYKYILEKAYKMQISDMYILVLHPKQDNYIRIHIPVLSREISGIVAYRKKQLGVCKKRSIEELLLE